MASGFESKYNIMAVFLPGKFIMGDVKRLNLLLKTGLAVNRLFRKYKKREELLGRICDTLTRFQGYHRSLAVLINEMGKTVFMTSSGFRPDVPSIDGLHDKKDMDALLASSASPAIVKVRDHYRAGPVPLFFNEKGDSGGMSIGLTAGRRICGFLTVWLPIQFMNDEDECRFLTELARDVSHMLYAIESEKKRWHLETALRKTRDELESRLKERREELEVLSTRLLSAQEAERKRIAGDLHDGIGQTLSAIKLTVESVLEQVDDNLQTRIGKALKSLVPMLQEASEEVRIIVSNLRPSILDDLGILATMSWLTRQFKGMVSDIRIEEHIDLQEEDIPKSLKTTIFRILQEALNNIAKHSDANLVRIYLSKNKKGIELKIIDNGYGFDMARLNAASALKKGFGITGMKERTELSGGLFEITSTWGAGCRIKAFWRHDDLRAIS